MNVENTKKLYEKYPKLFIQHSKTMQETCMCWGFECEDGWYWLLDNLCTQLQWNIDKNGEEQIEVIQCKEKFGSMRFYTNGASDRQQGAIELAEYMSGSICEKCGVTGATQNNSGYIQTLCNNCREVDTDE